MILNPSAVLIAVWLYAADSAQSPNFFTNKQPISKHSTIHTANESAEKWLDWRGEGGDVDQIEHGKSKSRTNRSK